MAIESLSLVAVSQVSTFAIPQPAQLLLFSSFGSTPKLAHSIQMTRKPSCLAERDAGLVIDAAGLGKGRTHLGRGKCGQC
jgi:hypothetical protein